MKKKRLVGAIIASSIALTSTFTGCSLVTANNAADMEQVIAEVNISAADNLGDSDGKLVDSYKSTVGTSSIVKRDLIAYFLNAGYSQVQSGASYSAVFESLLNGLVENSVLTQYALMSVMDYKAGGSSAETVISQYNSKATYAEKLEYLLEDPVAYPDDAKKDIKIAKYGLYTSINNAIDSYEEQLFDEEDTVSGSESRSTPGGVDTVRDDYYPAKEDGELDYNVYTGYAGFQLADSGVYKDDVNENSTKSTRIKAYNNFIASLADNGLVDPEEEDLRNIKSLKYIQSEYETQLESRIIEKYYDLYEASQDALLSDGGEYGYLSEIYDDLVRSDRQKYENASSFNTAMDNMSDTSFVLYSPDTEGDGTFGYVYNILLPFDSVQELILTGYQSSYKDDDGEYNIEYYRHRALLLKGIKTTDQRSAWFNGATDYSFKAEPGTYYDSGKDDENPYPDMSRGYLFFENNLSDTEHYKPLEKYAGKYAYNGYAYEREDGSYVLVPNKLDIDKMLDEFTGYVNYVLGSSGKAEYTINPGYGVNEENFYSDADKKEIEYKNFIYASGKVTFAEEMTEQQYRGNLLNKDSAQYKALSAVNELQYAYTTDTGVLSQYLGYSVAIGANTGYIKEFETAAHEAIAQGAGSFCVCAGDYGWHLIYVTYTFGLPDADHANSSAGGEEYAPDWKNNVKVEGTFENLFYEWVKSTDIDEISTARRTQIINKFNKESTVTKYQSRYQDLLDLGN